MTRFYLGIGEPAWMPLVRVPVFVSRRRLARRVELPRAGSAWALDSGGFSELKLHGRWTIGPRDYADEARRYRDRVGRLEWAAIQDWMCEPEMVAKTGRSVREHQELTLASFHELRRVAPDMPWVPVVQGYHRDDYLRHAEDYRLSGIDLAAEPLVGIGSVCRRQAMAEAAVIVRAVAGLGLALHGFGVKADGLALFGNSLRSADSMAWSYVARRRKIRLRGCPHPRCNNCLRFALKWRKRLVLRIAPVQATFAWRAA